ncbi:mate-domain-containing protein [Exophiala viscosa]|nr:mate-domain-containing protein [Exophiala viscosa]
MSSMLIISPRGKVEFGAVSVATTTANITGFMIFQGLCTSLDTLCAQAWGSGNPELKQLHVQRMIVVLGAVGSLVAILWFYANYLFSLILPDPTTYMLAGLYLKILICAIPGYVVFEAGKRVLTAEGIFFPVTVILCAGACTNAFLGWLLVWRCDFGFIGGPIAVATTWTIMPVYLWAYLRLAGRGGLWPCVTSRGLRGWSPMLKLALPGLVMVEAEYLAFEILVIASAQLSTEDLAAQTILAALNSAFWQIPFSISIAGTTMIAQHIGAGSARLAKISALVVFVSALLCSATNSILFFSFRAFWPRIFTNDPDVVVLVVNTLPLVAAMQLVDGLVACCNGILRGCGRQSVGGWVNLSCYYVVALPLSFWTTFGLHWGLKGLWAGVTFALVLVTFAELMFLSRADWQKSVEDAEWRNSRPLNQEP